MNDPGPRPGRVTASSVALGDLVDDTGWFDPSTPLSLTRYGYADASQPVVSFVVPVFNQEPVIAAHLDSIRENATNQHEVIVIVDGCTDDSLRQVSDWAVRCAVDGKTLGVTVAEVREGIFETLSDSVGARLATGDLLIEVQADMLIQDPGFDAGMFSALSEHPEIVVVGGRGAHSFGAAGLAGTASPFSQRLVRRMVTSSSKASRRYSPTRLELRLSDSIGRGGELIDTPHVTYPSRLFVHETTMRGPWAVRRQEFADFGGFDTGRFFLGNDDHDFALRALSDHNRRTAYLPIQFSSPLELGSTRAPRPLEAAKRFAAIRRHYEERFAGSRLARGLPRTKTARRYAVDHDWRLS